MKTVDDFMARNEDSGAFLTARSSAAVNQTSELGWSIVAMVSMPHVMAPIYRVRALMLALAVVLGGAFVLLTWLVSKRVVQPIADFATEANRFDPESTTAFRPVAESRLDELGTLARTMSALVAKLRILVGRNQLFIEHAPVPLAIFDKQMRYLMVSRRWLSDYGLSEREVIGQSHYDVLPEIPEHWRALHQRGLAGEVLQSPGECFTHADGRKQWIRWEIRPWHLPDGAIGGIAIFSEDITARIEAEQALQTSEQRLRLATEVARIGIFDWDIQRKTIMWAPELEALYGMPPSRTGSTYTYDAWLKTLHPDDATHALAKVEEALRVDHSVEADWRIVWPDQTVRWVTARFQVFRDEADKPQHMIGVNIDSTHQKAMEAELRKNATLLSEFNLQLTGQVEEQTLQLRAAKEEAEAANFAKGRFLANMSHEIRTPLNALIGLSRLLLKKQQDPDAADKLAKIDAAGRHLLSVINDILDFSKIEAGKLQLSEEVLDVRVMSANVCSMVAEAANAKGLEIKSEIDDFPPRVQGDPTRLTQALLNLASNAVKFTQEGSVTVRAVKESEDQQSLVIRFEVIDTGIGIPQEAMDRLFNPFEQADASTLRRFGGTGLGLVITRRLAQMMGGDAGVVSVDGQGSTFWFTARLQKTDEAVASPEMTSDGAAAEQLLARFSGARVLLAEDNEINQLVAQALLADVGLECDLADDGEAAVARIRDAQQGAYALILMDMQMPRMDGITATKAIRALDVGRHLPIVAMTANAFSEDQARCLEAGMNDFVAKPVQPEKLYATLLKWLAQP